MQARWSSVCPRCGEPIPIGAEIKRRFVRTGMKPNGRPEFTMTDEWVHKACKASRQPRAPLIDPETGEILA